MMNELVPALAVIIIVIGLAFLIIAVMKQNDEVNRNYQVDVFITKSFMDEFMQGKNTITSEVEEPKENLKEETDPLDWP